MSKWKTNHGFDQLIPIKFIFLNMDNNTKSVAYALIMVAELSRKWNYCGSGAFAFRNMAPASPSVRFYTL